MAELQLLLNDLERGCLRAAGGQARLRNGHRARGSRHRLRAHSARAGRRGRCGWLLSLYRRRSEASMQAAIDTTAQEARTDELTGLPNRRALLEELEQRCEANERFTLTLADLNGFKRYNDHFGHAAGDALLRRLGRKLAAACEGRGMAARLGGDEFCVLFFEATPAEEAHALLGKPSAMRARASASPPPPAWSPCRRRRRSDRGAAPCGRPDVRGEGQSAPEWRAGDVPGHDANARRAPPGPRHPCRGGVHAGRELRRGARSLCGGGRDGGRARSCTTSARWRSPRRS